jgi:sarcosine oxidase/L-pipecolate oxidase
MNTHPTLNPFTTSTSVLIIGAGTFGISTAYHLAVSGYRNLKVLDRAAIIPSSYSAGTDLNKIIRAEYEDPFYTSLALVTLTTPSPLSPSLLPY